LGAGGGGVGSGVGVLAAGGVGLPQAPATSTKPANRDSRVKTWPRIGSGV